MDEHSETLHGPVRMWLVLMSNGQPDRAVEVRGDQFVIGRGEECDLVLDDQRVSREHAAIVPGPPGRRLLHDLDSANGTLLNGRPLTTPPGFAARTERKIAELWGDERLQFGDTMIVTTTQDPQPLLAQQKQQTADRQTSASESSVGDDTPPEG